MFCSLVSIIFNNLEVFQIDHRVMYSTLVILRQKLTYKYSESVSCCASQEPGSRG